MKKAKIFISAVLSACLCTSAFAANTVTMYSLDGREAKIHSDEAKAYSKVGWYYAPVEEMRSADGRSIIVYKSEKEAYKKVGWFDAKEKTAIYAPDGRSCLIYKWQLQSYLKAGWYSVPVTTMYSKDGRSIVVALADVDAYKKVGWSTLNPATSFPFSKHEVFSFSSGAGGWITVMTVYPDGSFSGKFNDSNMGESGFGYLGTEYICNFTGKFGNIRKINNYSYSMTLESLKTDRKEGTKWISNRVLYVASTPYGLEKGKDFILYNKNTEAYRFSEEFKSWWLDYRYGEPKPNALKGYAIYNVSEGYAFFN